MERSSARVLSFSLPPVRSPICSSSPQASPYRANRSHYQDWFKDFHTDRPIFITGVFDDYVGLGQGAGNIDRIQNTHRHFFNDLHRTIFKKSKRKIPRLVVIEKGAGRFHSHIVIETPGHLSRYQFIKMLTASWMKTKHGVNLHCVIGYDKDGLDRYCSKELGNNNNISYSQVDVKHCCRTKQSLYAPQGGERVAAVPSRKNFPDTHFIIS